MQTFVRFSASGNEYCLEQLHIEVVNSRYNTISIHHIYINTMYSVFFLATPSMLYHVSLGGCPWRRWACPGLRRGCPPVGLTPSQQGWLWRQIGTGCDCSNGSHPSVPRFPGAWWCLNEGCSCYRYVSPSGNIFLPYNIKIGALLLFQKTLK